MLRRATIYRTRPTILALVTQLPMPFTSIFITPTYTTLAYEFPFPAVPVFPPPVRCRSEMRTQLLLSWSLLPPWPTHAHFSAPRFMSICLFSCSPYHLYTSHPEASILLNFYIILWYPLSALLCSSYVAYFFSCVLYLIPHSSSLTRKSQDRSGSDLQSSHLD